jgi:pimeloyl-ACP methyl ester carboxylesterase
LSILNRNGQQLQGFLFAQTDAPPPAYTILYLHGNGGSKVEALPIVDLIGEFSINLVAFDMLGCGNSDPAVLTYGVNEVFDIREILQEVRRVAAMGRLVLWGRSMGSLCAIMFA